jgi:predicted transcriptional regulator
MQFGIEDILLFAIGIMENEMNGGNLAKREFCDALGISNSTLNRHIKKLIEVNL